MHDLHAKDRFDSDYFTLTAAWKFLRTDMSGPMQPWIDQTWRPGEIELVK